MNSCIWLVRFLCIVVAAAGSFSLPWNIPLWDTPQSIHLFRCWGHLVFHFGAVEHGSRVSVTQLFLVSRAATNILVCTKLRFKTDGSGAFGPGANMVLFFVFLVPSQRSYMR